MVWDATKVDGVDGLSAAEWNTHVTDQKGHKARHETSGSDALTALSAAILTSGILPAARLDGSSPRIKVGSFTRDLTTATGGQAITGVGFQPSGLIILASITDPGSTSAFSIGFSDDTNSGDVRENSNASMVASTISGRVVDLLFEPQTNEYYASFGSFDSDGFTLNWTKAGSPTGTARMIYIAFR